MPSSSDTRWQLLGAPVLALMNRLLPPDENAMYYTLSCDISDLVCQTWAIAIQPFSLFFKPFQLCIRSRSCPRSRAWLAAHHRIPSSPVSTKAVALTRESAHPTSSIAATTEVNENSRSFIHSSHDRLHPPHFATRSHRDCRTDHVLQPSALGVHVNFLAGAKWSDDPQR